MTDFLRRLRQRKLVQWALAYIAAAFALIQVVDVVAQRFGWPGRTEKLIILALAIGFFVVLLLAWYHGDRGAQRMSGAELLLLALVLAIGGVVVWRFIGQGAMPNAPRVAAAQSPRAAASVSRTASARVLAATNASASHAASAAPLTAQPIPAKSVAVLPFENLSTDKANAYFADGMQDLILTKLADIGDLKVISRTSTMQYGSHPGNLKTIARQLGVATILEGSVQKAGKQVLINVQLIDARTDSHIWAESYQRTLDNIFGVEGEVADKVAKALNAKLTASESTRVASVPTHDPVAYDLYLKAQGIEDEVATGGWAAIPVAIAAYRKVIQRDPDFALAYTQVAFMQALLYWTGANRSPAMMRNAEANVRKALALQPNLPQAHLVLGYVYRWGYNDYAKALAEYKLAAAGMPNSADVAEAIAYIHEDQGDMPAAIAQMQRAMTFDPRDPHLPCQLAIIYSITGNYPRARQALARAFAINPTDTEAYWLSSQVDLLENGDAAGALTLLDSAPAAIRSSTQLITARINALLLKRDFVAARHYAEQLRPGQGMSALQVDQTKGNVLWLSGAHKDAAPFYTKALDLLKTELPTTTRPFQTYADLALAAARLGRPQEARDYGRRMIALAGQKGRVIPYDLGIMPWKTLASAYASTGDSGAAVSALGHALARASGFWISVPLLKLDPTWDPIRHDPGFLALLNKYGHTKPTPATSGTVR